MKLRNIFILFCSIFLVFNSTPISVLGQENNEEVPMNEEINDEKNNELNEGNNEEEEITEENQSTNEEPNKSTDNKDKTKHDQIKDKTNDENQEPKIFNTNSTEINQNEDEDEDKESENLFDYFKPGDRDDEIKEIKIKLMKAGFGTNWKNPTNYFGPDTERVVRKFQVYYKIPETGVMDEEFLNKLEEVISSHYQKGNRSEEILQFKRNLIRLGFGLHWNNPTNYYGPDTEKVVREFQESNNLVVNGIADPITLQNLNNLLQELEEKGFSKGMRSAEIQQLKLDLMKVGFGTHWKNPTTYFGADTEKVVKEFQNYYSLTPTGALDVATQNKLKEILSSPFQKGNRSEEIQKIKYDLMKVGFGTHWKNPTTYYGVDTEKVVREFQEANRLVVNGIFDEVTKERLEDMLKNGFSRGMGSPFIQDIKKDLMKAGFGTHWKNPTTYFGADTEKVVREFQKYYSLTVDGTINDETLEKIEEVLNSPYRKGKRSNKIQELKIDLMKVGFGLHWNNPTDYYGADTENVVREFQRSYKLAVNGILDEVSLKKLEDLIGRAITPKTRSEEVRQIKYDLMKSGFGTHWTNPTTYYGSETENVVREFQEYYSLYVDGVLHVGTLNKLKEVLNSPYQYGKSSSQIQKLKEDLMKIGFGTHWKNPTTYYGKDTERVVREFQEAYDLVVNGIIDEVTMAKIKELLKSNRYTQYNITLKEALEIQMKVSPQTDKKEYAYVHKNHINKNNVVTANVLNVRSGPGTKYKRLGTLQKGTEVVILDQIGDWYAIQYKNSTWVHAIAEDVLYYLDPDNFKNDKIQKFQFLDLSRLSGATRVELNEYLKGKGTLHNQGKAFLDAGRIHRVNEVYLISHAILETGHGTSDLASGKIKVGEVSKNKFVVQLPNGRIYIVEGNEAKQNDNYNLKGIKLRDTYNMFGIGAYDRNPNVFGAVRAYQEGWFTPYDAIVGGARFIGNNYIQAGQNTLYKMRWNPAAMEKGSASHQYATDIGWAYKQVDRIYRLYQDIGIDTYFLDIPVYK